VIVIVVALTFMALIAVIVAILFYKKT